MKRILLPILILGCCVMLAGVLINNPPQVEETSPEIIPVSVRVAPAQIQSVNLTVQSQGKVQAAQRASVAAPVAGPVAWVSPALELGAFVKQGEVLLRLDTSDFEAALGRSRAALQQAKAEADHAANELQRIEELADKRLVSDSQLQDSKRMASVSSARLSDAQVSFDQTQLDLQRSEIKAPFDAIIEQKDVELGQYVNRAQSIAVLYGADVVEVRVPLASRQLGFLDIPLGLRGELPPSQAPDVTLTGQYGGQKHQWQGKLLRTEATIDANSNTVQTIIRVQQPSAESNHSSKLNNSQIPLPIGLYVEAQIEGKRVDDIIVLPRKVIRNNNQVLVVDQENRMSFREVEILRLEEDVVLVSAGISAGEYICISPIQAVTNGMLVDPIIEQIL